MLTLNKTSYKDKLYICIDSYFSCFFYLLISSLQLLIFHEIIIDCDNDDDIDVDNGHWALKD